MAEQIPADQQTIHVFFNHQCPKCKAMYIPYDKDEPCPRCGLVETKRFDFIPRAAESAKFNLAQRGGFLPEVWWVGSLADFVLYLVFEILEQFRQEGNVGDLGMLARDILKETDMGDKPYLREHVVGIAVRVFETLVAEEE